MNLVSVVSGFDHSPGSFNWVSIIRHGCLRTHGRGGTHGLRWSQRRCKQRAEVSCTGYIQHVCYRSQLHVGACCHIDPTTGRWWWYRSAAVFGDEFVTGGGFSVWFNNCVGVKINAVSIFVVILWQFPGAMLFNWTAVNVITQVCKLHATISELNLNFNGKYLIYYLFIFIHSSSEGSQHQT